MTIDEAIEYYIKAATQRAIADEEMGVNDNSHWNETKFMTKKQSEQIITDNRQLAEWLEELRARRHYMEKICEVLAEQFDSPCNFSPIDEYMLKNGCCEDCCGGDIPNVECWSRYLQTKIVGGSGNG